MQFSDNEADVTSIPTPFYPPTPVPLSSSDIQKSTLVVFDLEKSNIGKWPSNLLSKIKCRLLLSIFACFAVKAVTDKYMALLCFCFTVS